MPPGTRTTLAGTRRALTLRTGTTLPGTGSKIALALRTRRKAALTLRARPTLAGTRRIAALLTLGEHAGGLARGAMADPGAADNRPARAARTRR